MKPKEKELDDLSNMLLDSQEALNKLLGYYETDSQQEASGALVLSELDRIRKRLMEGSIFLLKGVISRLESEIGLL